MKCAECGADGTHSGEFTTLVGFGGFPAGHNHDDNCRTRYYHCPNGHSWTESRRNRCHADGCDWKGKEECFCHQGPKVDEWTE